jgi:hypothetical protein
MLSILKMQKKWRNIFLLILGVLFLLLDIFCEQPKVENGRFFCFPPGCKPEESATWSYCGKVAVIETSYIVDEDKDVVIYIKNSSGDFLLKDNFSIHGSYVNNVVHWPVFDSIGIALVNERQFDTILQKQYVYDSLARSFIDIM